MIFQAKNRVWSHPRLLNASGGFTLLELVIVLGVIAILVTWMTLSVGTVETEEKLRYAAGDITALTKRARSIAVQQQRPYKLTISKKSIAISPLNNLSEDEIFKNQEGSENQRFQAVIDSEETDADVIYEIRRWRSEEWITIEDGKEEVIVLDPLGLVEPIAIRCTVGKSWLMQEFHPLTAGVRDEEMSIEKE